MNARSATGRPPVVAFRLYAGRTREARRSSRRDAFLAAGLELFGTQGFRNTSVRALCVHARFTERYFYESFENSEALLHACYEKLVGEIGAELIEAAESAHVDPLDAVVMQLLRRLREPRAHRLLMFEVVHVTPSIDAMIDKTVDRLGTLVSSVLKAPAVSPLATHGMMGALLFMLRRAPQEAAATPSQVTRTIRHMMEAALIVGESPSPRGNPAKPRA